MSTSAANLANQNADAEYQAYLAQLNAGDGDMQFTGVRNLKHLAEGGHRLSIEALDMFLCRINNIDLLLFYLDALYPLLLQQREMKFDNSLFNTAVKLADAKDNVKAQSRAQDIWRKLAEHGHVESLYVMTLLDCDSKDEIQSKSAKIKLLQLATNRGHAKSAQKLAEIHKHDLSLHLVFNAMACIADPALSFATKSSVPGATLFKSYDAERKTEQVLRDGVKQKRFQSIQHEFKTSDPIATILLATQHAPEVARINIANTCLKMLPESADSKIALISRAVQNTPFAKAWRERQDDAKKLFTEQHVSCTVENLSARPQFPVLIAGLMISLGIEKITPQWFEVALMNALNRDNFALLKFVLTLQELPRKQDKDDLVYRALCVAIQQKKPQAVVMLGEKLGDLKLSVRQMPLHLAAEFKQTSEGKRSHLYFLCMEEKQQCAQTKNEIHMRDQALPKLTNLVRDIVGQTNHPEDLLSIYLFIVDRYLSLIPLHGPL